MESGNNLPTLPYFFTERNQASDFTSCGESYATPMDWLGYFQKLISNSWLSILIKVKAYYPYLRGNMGKIRI